MNQKKTSKKTSLFEPTYSSVSSVSKDSLRIARPAILSNDATSQQSTQVNKTELLHSDFELQKYYENLNQTTSLNLQNISQITENNQTNQFSNDKINVVDTANQNNLINESSEKANYSSYFTINRLTNYFVYSKNTESQSNAENQDNVYNSDNLDESDCNKLPTEQYIADLRSSSDSSTMNDSNLYHLPKPHWFYKLPLNSKQKDSNNSEKTIYDEQIEQQEGIVPDLNDSLDENWLPFAFHDSDALEKAYLSIESNPSVVVSTNGDRYDCFIKDRFRRSVYWKEDDQPIRRCTWYFKKEGHTRFIPYTEQFAFKLEQIYYDVLMNNKWNQRIELSSTSQEMIIFYSYNSIIHYELNDNQIKDEWNTVNENPVKPKVVNRELTIDELENYLVCLKEDELYAVDHIVFCVHGIGSICDIRMRSIKEVVDDLRKISLELTGTHFRSNSNLGSEKQEQIGRVEFIPVFWHDFLHGNETGIDERLKTITLKSVPKLRAFTNDSLLDALFYTSQIYCQHIVNVVTEEINRLYDLFISRNPYFKGTVSLSGHSLGSVILFDLLANQGKNEPNEKSRTQQTKKLSDSLIYNATTKYYGQESIEYPKLKFKTDCFFALGSPISMFLMLRGFTEIDQKFTLPECKHVFNIFHPLDPIAYRIEPMLNQKFDDLSPVIIPHHKGRRRMHIEIKENLVKMGSDIKEKVLFGIKSTWNSVGSFFPRTNSNLSEINEQLINSDQSNELVNSNSEESEIYDYSNDLSMGNNRKITVGALNCDRRIDYVLQEKPIEFFNQYIFALSSHCCYWSSEDCVLFMLKELFKLQSIYLSNDIEDANQNMSESIATNHQHSNQQQLNNQQSFSDIKNSSSLPSSSNSSTFVQDKNVADRNVASIVNIE